MRKISLFFFFLNELPNVDLRKQIQHNQIMVEALKKSMKLIKNTRLLFCFFMFRVTLNGIDTFLLNCYI